MRAIAGFLALAVVLGVLAMFSGDSPAPDAPPPAADPQVPGAADDLVGQAAPLQFTMKDVNGVSVKLSSFTGKVIIVNFWATWCPPCRAEIPDLVALQNEHRDDLVVLGIDVMDQFSKVPAFAKEFEVNYPLLDGNGRDDVENAFGPMFGLPTSVIIGRDGKVASRHSGIASKEQFRQYVESLL